MKRSTLMGAAFLSLAGAIGLPGLVALEQKDFAVEAVERANKRLAGIDEAIGAEPREKPAAKPATKLEEYKAQ